MPTLLSVTGLSDIGRIRRRNEDSLALDPDLGITVVADGMGGHPGGDVASQVAARAACNMLAEAIQADASADGFTDRLRPLMAQAVLGAHAQIRERGSVEPHLDGMGTTLTAMVAHPTSGAWVIGHVGDSRAYRIHEGILEQITRDDTWIQQQIESNPDLSPAAARHSPYAHLLTQCLGLEDEPTPQVLDGMAAAGDSFLLCSDGLVGMLEDHTMLSILAESFAEPDQGPDVPILRLLAAANDAGGNDNITAALVRYTAD